jgi:hypothetical protein
VDGAAELLAPGMSRRCEIEGVDISEVERSSAGCKLAIASKDILGLLNLAALTRAREPSMSRIQNNPSRIDISDGQHNPVVCLPTQHHAEDLVTSTSR